MGWQIESFPQVEPSPWGDPLHTDFVFSNRAKKKLVVSISGTHGIEGYLGSDVQTQIARSGTLEQESEFDVLLVHALNPFGMAWYSRTNGSNVDLNRNANLSFDKSNPDYQKFLGWIHSRPGWNRKLEFSKLIFYFLIYGYEKMHRALALGQFDDPRGLFYGGKSLHPELQRFLDFLKRISSQYSSVIVLDLHTGLGKPKTESLILDGTREDEEEILSQVFETRMIDCRKEPNFYVCHGPLSDGVRKLYPQDRVFYVYQEFGTLNSFEISDTLIDSTQNLTQKQPFSLELAERMLNCFYPAAPEWREFCVAKGVERFRQIYFSKLTEQGPTLI